MQNWDGSERRQVNQDSVERDRLLTAIHHDLKNHLDNFDELHREFKEHAKEDKELFKYLYLALGGISVLVFILNHVWK